MCAVVNPFGLPFPILPSHAGMFRALFLNNSTDSILLNLSTLMHIQINNNYAQITKIKIKKCEREKNISAFIIYYTIKDNR